MLLRSRPVLCNYYLTYRCNARCSFCDIWEKPSPYASEEAFKANLRDLRRLGVKIIDLTGGEPLLHRRAAEFCRLAKEAGMITTLTTNALLYPKHAQALAGNVDMLHFSLDYAEKSAHDALRGVACYDFVIESIRIARSLNERPDVLFTVKNDNVAHIERVYEEICRPNGLILILNPIFSYNGVGEDLSPRHFPVLRQWAKKRGVYLNTAFLDLRQAGGNRTSKPVCRAGTSTVVISPDNALVLPCYHLGVRTLPIEGNLYEVWHSQQARHWRQAEGRMPACEGCVVNC
ncbi:MAG: radical SAM protein, partial [Bacteroidia bacterium]|nr:radical SAM protein [Bacteroidia bacterium]